MAIGFRLPKKTYVTNGQYGVAMIEMLISFLVLAVGLLALLSFQSTTQKNNADAKTQAEAVAVAEQKLHQLESFLSATDTRLLTTGNGSDSVTGGTATFARSWTVSKVVPTCADVADASAENYCGRRVQVIVAWNDRDNISQQVKLSSEVFFGTPTAGVQHFFNVVADAGVTGGSSPWGNGSGSGSGSGSGQGSGSGAGSGSGSGNGSGSGSGPQYSLIPLVISGSLSGTNSADITLINPQFSTAQIDGQQLLYATCSITNGGRGFTCNALYFSSLQGWTGTVTIGTNKVFCSVSNSEAVVAGALTPTLVFAYTNLNANDNNMTVYVANRATQC
jgi:Tfp pilus assembly protein PilV